MKKFFSKCLRVTSYLYTFQTHLLSDRSVKRLVSHFCHIQIMYIRLKENHYLIYASECVTLCALGGAGTNNGSWPARAGGPRLMPAPVFSPAPGDGVLRAIGDMPERDAVIISTRLKRGITLLHHLLKPHCALSFCDSYRVSDFSMRF